MTTWSRIVASFQGERNHAVGLEFPTHRPDARRSRDLHRRPLPEPGPGRATRSISTRKPGRKARCRPEVRCIAVAAPGHTRTQQIWSFARNSEAALGQADYDCTVGFINTYAHDVIIPQGGVHGGSLQANALRFASRSDPPALPAGQDAQSQVLDLPGDRAPAVCTRPPGPGGRRQQHGPASHPAVPPRAPRPDPRRAQRHRPRARSRSASPAPCAVRSATGWDWSRPTWSACSWATTSRSRV